MSLETYPRQGPVSRTVDSKTYRSAPRSDGIEPVPGHESTSFCSAFSQRLRSSDQKTETDPRQVGFAIHAPRPKRPKYRQQFNAPCWIQPDLVLGHGLLVPWRLTAGLLAVKIPWPSGSVNGRLCGVHDIPRSFQGTGMAGTLRRYWGCLGIDMCKLEWRRHGGWTHNLPVGSDDRLQGPEEGQRRGSTKGGGRRVAQSPFMGSGSKSQHGLPLNHCSPVPSLLNSPRMLLHLSPVGNVATITPKDTAKKVTTTGNMAPMIPSINP